jgi:hypothetical protein
MVNGKANKGKLIKGISLCISLALLLTFNSCTSRSDGSIRDRGESIVFTSPNQIMTAVKGRTLEETLVLLGAEPMLDPKTLAYVDGRIVAVRPEEVGRLLLGGRNVQHLTLVASNRLTQKQIQAIMQMISRKSHPIISVSLTEIFVTDLTYQDAKVYLSGDVQRQYLVNQVRIIKEKYR